MFKDEYIFNLLHAVLRFKNLIILIAQKVKIIIK